MPTPEPTVRPACHWVSCLPEGDVNFNAFLLRVEYRGDGRWAVTDGHRFFAADEACSHGFGWAREPVGDEEMDAFERDREAWLAEYRFDEETALRIAREVAPLMTVNGWTVQDALDKAAAAEQHDTETTAVETATKETNHG